jgi:hypothetical protein
MKEIRKSENRKEEEKEKYIKGPRGNQIGPVRKPARGPSFLSRTGTL